MFLGLIVSLLAVNAEAVVISKHLSTVWEAFKDENAGRVWISSENNSEDIQEQTNAVVLPFPFKLKSLVQFCACDMNVWPWVQYVKTDGYNCWKDKRKIAPFHFGEANEVFVGALRDSVMNYSSCPVGALTIATIVGSVFEVHDLSERNYVDAEHWEAVWSEYEDPVRNFLKWRLKIATDETLDVAKLKILYRNSVEEAKAHRKSAQDAEGERSDAEINFTDSGKNGLGVDGKRSSGVLLQSLGSRYNDPEHLFSCRDVMVLATHADVERNAIVVRIEHPKVPKEKENSKDGGKRFNSELDTVMESESEFLERRETPTVYQHADDRTLLVRQDFVQDEPARDFRMLQEWVFDAGRFTYLLERIDRKMQAWGRLLYQNAGDTPTIRELKPYHNKLLEQFEHKGPYSPFDEDPNRPLTAQAEKAIRDTVHSFAASPQVMERQEKFTDKEKEDASLCLCFLFGNGAKTFVHTLHTFEAVGFLDLAREKFVVYLQDAGEDSAEQCWRQSAIEDFFGLKPVAWNKYRWPDTHIKISRHVAHMRTGTSMMSCGMESTSEHILLLEEDWEVISRPSILAMMRIQESIEMLKERKADMVHLRHKIFYGPPYYELLTAIQHNEPPPISLAMYFADDPVASAKFPEKFWSPPFEEDLWCDNNRVSWYWALAYQRGETRPEFGAYPEIGSGVEQRDRNVMELNTTRASYVSPLYWCTETSSLLCSSTKAESDPFRNLFYTTNPTMYRRKDWIKHFGAVVGILGDARAIEESITVSHAWRVDPGYVVAFSPGLFRHKRSDRATYQCNDKCKATQQCQEDEQKKKEQEEGEQQQQEPPPEQAMSQERGETNTHNGNEADDDGQKTFEKSETDEERQLAKKIENHYSSQ